MPETLRRYSWGSCPPFEGSPIEAIQLALHSCHQSHSQPHGDVGLWVDGRGGEAAEAHQEDQEDYVYSDEGVTDYHYRSRRSHLEPGSSTLHTEWFIYIIEMQVQTSSAQIGWDPYWRRLRTGPIEVNRTLTTNSCSHLMRMCRASAQSSCENNSTPTWIQ